MVKTIDNEIYYRHSYLVNYFNSNPMTYVPFPPNSTMSDNEFIKQLNLALPSCSEFIAGMVVKSDGNGYFLENNGVEVFNPLLLSEARKQVLRK